VSESPDLGEIQKNKMHRRDILANKNTLLICHKSLDAMYLCCGTL